MLDIAAMKAIPCKRITYNDKTYFQYSLKNYIELVNCYIYSMWELPALMTNKNQYANLCYLVAYVKKLMSVDVIDYFLIRSIENINNVLMYFGLEHDNLKDIGDMFETLRYNVLRNGSYNSLLIFNGSLSIRTKDIENRPYTYNKDDGNLYTKDGHLCTFIDTCIREGDSVLLSKDFIEILEEEVSCRTYQIQLTSVSDQKSS
jgi:hypothetical protein